MKWLAAVLTVLLAISVSLNVGQYRSKFAAECDTVTLVDYVAWRDTAPAMAAERIVTHYVTVCPKSKTADSVTKTGISLQMGENVSKKTDSFYTFPIVQRTFSDDSTYTAYVSGPKIDSVGPRLDSIAVYGKFVTRTVTVTKTQERKGRHWHFGLGGGAGYGLTTRKTDVWVGGVVVYEF